MLRRKRFWFGLIISVSFLGFFLSQTDFNEIRDAFGQADLILACAVAPLYFVGFWIRAVRWRILLRPVSDISTKQLYPIVLIGLMANNVAPARVGELVRAYLLGERQSMSKSTALGTIAVDRAYDGLTLVAILGIVTAFSGANTGVKSVGVATAFLFLAASTILVSLAFSPTQARSWLLRLIRLLPGPLAGRLGGLLDAFLAGLQAIRSPSALLKAAVASLASWLVEGAMYYVIGRAFGLDVGFHVYLIILAGANLALSVLASPGGVGPFEVTTNQILIYFGVADATAKAYAIALHALLLGPVIVVGFLLLWLTSLSLKDLLGASRSTPVPGLPSQGIE